jgi:hypothetical protein
MSNGKMATRMGAAWAGTVVQKRMEVKATISILLINLRVVFFKRVS